MVIIKLSSSHPSMHVKVFVEGRPFHINKRGVNIPDEFINYFMTDSFEITGLKPVIEEVKVVEQEEITKEKIVPKKKGFFKRK